MQTRIPFEKNKKIKRAAHNSKRRFISESKFRRVLWPSMGSAAVILILIFQLVHVSVPKSYSISVIFSNFQKKIDSLYHKNLKKNLMRYFRLEHLQWTEIGKTNLSDLVTESILTQITGLKVGPDATEDLFSIDLNSLEKKLLSFAWIESVQIQKKLPSTLTIKYTTHQAKAYGLRKNKLWLIASSGAWLAPVPNGFYGEGLSLVLVHNDEDMDKAFYWLDFFNEQQELISQIHQIHVTTSKIAMLVEFKNAKIGQKIMVFLPKNHPVDSVFLENLKARLSGVVSYLSKNNIFISSIDLRLGKKVVVNIGKQL